MKTKMTFAEYARHKGVSKQAVSSAAQDGRITFQVDKENGGKFLFKEDADKEWGENTDYVKRMDLAQPTSDENSSDEDEYFSEDADYDKEADAAGIPKLAYSKRLRESLKAEREELELKKLKAELLPADKVNEEFFSLGRAIRDSILSIPDRLSSELAAEKDADRIHSKLTEELSRALEQLANLESDSNDNQ